jgi:hypothetical protein
MCLAPYVELEGWLVLSLHLRFPCSSLLITPRKQEPFGFPESLVPLGYVAPRLLTCLSPRDDMIPDEGIMARPIG